MFLSLDCHYNDNLHKIDNCAEMNPHFCLTAVPTLLSALMLPKIIRAGRLWVAFLWPLLRRRFSPQVAWLTLDSQRFSDPWWDQKLVCDWSWTPLMQTMLELSFCHTEVLMSRTGPSVPHPGQHRVHHRLLVDALVQKTIQRLIRSPPRRVWEVTRLAFSGFCHI